MKNWFATLNPRERAIVLTGGCLVALVLIYTAVAEPMWQALQERRARVQSQVELLAWMESSAALVQRLKSTNTEHARIDSKQAPYLQLDASIRRLGLPAPARLEPRGQDGARVQFDDVGFDKLVRMLGEMQASGLLVTDISISRREAGAVNANLSLSRGP